VWVGWRGETSRTRKKGDWGTDSAERLAKDCPFPHSSRTYHGKV